jgi:hypothetical protein
VRGKFVYKEKKMKSTRFLLAILAKLPLVVTLVFGMTVVGCGDTDDIVKKALEYISTDAAGREYILKITGEGSGKTGAEGDSYELTIKETGQPDKKSKGKVSKTGADGTLTLQPNNSGSEPFAVTVSNDQMTNISGTIAVEGGEPVSAPGTLTPKGSDNGGNGSGGTFTLTGIPAEYNGEYVALLAYTVSDEVTMTGYQSFNSSEQKVTACRISNGSVSLPLWVGPVASAVRYSGNDTVGTLNIARSPQLFTSIVVANSIIRFNSVTFTNGSATRSWSDGY